MFPTPSLYILKLTIVCFYKFLQRLPFYTAKWFVWESCVGVFFVGKLTFNSSKNYFIGGSWMVIPFSSLFETPPFRLIQQLRTLEMISSDIFRAKEGKPLRTSTYASSLIQRRSPEVMPSQSEYRYTRHRRRSGVSQTSNITSCSSLFIPFRLNQRIRNMR